jgi:hypothetical protein
MKEYKDETKILNKVEQKDDDNGITRIKYDDN